MMAGLLLSEEANRVAQQRYYACGGWSMPSKKHRKKKDQTAERRIFHFSTKFTLFWILRSSQLDHIKNDIYSSQRAFRTLTFREMVPYQVHFSYEY